MFLRALLVPLAALAACTGSDCPECPELECPPCDQGAETLDAWEAELLADQLEEIRGGIKLWGDEGFGICKGQQDCETFIGTDGTELGTGTHLIKAELDVPPLGDDWKVEFHIECELVDSRGHISQQDHTKEYSVKYAGRSRGYLLQPLWKIQSPHPNGKRSCDFSLTPIRTDGKRREPWTGRYITPAPTE